MATEKAAPAAKKAPAKKPAAKRGPTKAAALKALGLTQADLDLIKNQPQQAEPVGPDADVELIQSITKAAVQGQPHQPIGQFYIRNLRNAEGSIRLSRQSDQKTKRLEFKPRGERGDIAPLQDGDLQDPQLIHNVGVLVEIITAAEAREIIEKQVTNSQQAVHPTMALLRNELNQPYAQGAVKVEPEFGSQGVTVAHLNPQGGGAGELPSTGRGVDWQAVKSGAQPTTSPGGNPHIISDGFNPPDMAADAVARRKDLEGPAAGGIQRVVVAEPEKA